jgi:hypothetical protein
MELEIRAKNNLLALKQNPYPGRVYWSPLSRQIWGH